ncbi:DUF934 domain-containing protein [Candidatus Ruthia endofausta]|uniref:DUF934 domain-containing protein n=1 Tax=Candidatus Ruthia endofausta TaxID=2738852 RepID=A0A6N0HQV3_9GAMM|nr:DUF934 domain-containing protein [Candidatus Ruthia endofausta]
MILNQAPLIAVDFSNFNNGRSYSQVKLLKKVVGYVGEIKALNVHIDHFAIKQLRTIQGWLNNINH